MIRHAFPQTHRGPLKKGVPMWDSTWGDSLATVFIFTGLAAAWLVQVCVCVFVCVQVCVCVSVCAGVYVSVYSFISVCICLRCLSVSLSERIVPSKVWCYLWCDASQRECAKISMCVATHVCVCINTRSLGHSCVCVRASAPRHASDKPPSFRRKP